MDLLVSNEGVAPVLVPDARETVTTPPPAPEAAPVITPEPPQGATVQAFCENDFRYAHSPGSPEGAGSLLEQAEQGALTGGLTAEATLSVATQGALPGNDNVRAMLGAMSTHPTDPSAKISTADYESRVAAPPEAVYSAFVKDPGRFFGAAGLRTEPATPELKNGARFFLEERSIPPVWAPVEARLDPEHHTIRLACLDGHPLRGFNEFRFEPDGHGGTRVRQHSEFQGSSAPMTAVGIHLMGLEDRQRDIWHKVHCELAKVKP